MDAFPHTPPRPVLLHQLSSEQRRVFLVLARRVIDADQRLTMREVEWLDHLYAETGVPAETADAPSAAGDLNHVFPDTRSRVAVVLELLLVGYTDGTIDPREIDAVRDVAAQMSIDAGTWEECLAWAERHQALVEDAASIGTHHAVGRP